MNPNNQTIRALAAILLLGVSAVSAAQGLIHPEPSRDAEKVRTFLRIGNIDQAEALLNGLPDRNRGDIVSLRAHVELMRQDYRGCLEVLKVLFDPIEPEVKVRYTTGFEHERAWYYLLQRQQGYARKAEQVRRDVLSEKRLKTDDSGFYDFTNASQVPEVAVYLHMAALEFAIGNTYRCRVYLKVARQLDPKVKVDPSLERSLKLLRSSEKSELDYDRRGGMFVILPSYEQLKKLVSVRPPSLGRKGLR